jgi:hypothetical protein
VGGEAKRKRGIGGLGIELRKDVIRMLTPYTVAESHRDGNDNASPRPILRSRRPQSTPRNFMHENRETSEISVIEADHRTAGEGQGRTARMHISEESDSGVVPMNRSNKDGRPLRAAISPESEFFRSRLIEAPERERAWPIRRLKPGN